MSLCSVPTARVRSSLDRYFSMSLLYDKQFEEALDKYIKENIKVRWYHKLDGKKDAKDVFYSDIWWQWEAGWKLVRGGYLEPEVAQYKERERQYAAKHRELEAMLAQTDEDHLLLDAKHVRFVEKWSK